MTDKPLVENLQGWLWKWTNYVKGYQQRWFVLSNGLFSYYRSQNEMSHTCRGTINLAGAFIASEADCNFLVSNGASQTFHLRASSTTERNKWVTALENAKIKAMIALHSDGSILKSTSALQSYSGKSIKTLAKKNIKIHRKMKKSKVLSGKLKELHVCNDLIVKHNHALQQAVDEIEALENSLQNFPDSLTSKLKYVREQATLFHITAASMLNRCSEFLQASEMEVKSWPDQILEEKAHEEKSTENGTSLLVGSSNQNDMSEHLIVPNGELVHTSSLSTTSSISFGDDDISGDEIYLDALNAAVASETSNFGTTSAKLNVVKVNSSINEVSSSAISKPVRQYRTKIPEKPDYSLNVWNVLKNCIGKDLSKIPMPVNFNEPLSFLQRLVEDIEYYQIIHTAAECTSALEQMAYVVALSVSTYCSTKERISKPFNPILGETFEFDRRHDLGFRAICEQVSHHPPAAAVYAESTDCGPNSGWSYWTEIQVTSKFRGKYLSVNPLGTVHLKFHKSGNHYTWQKITTTVHNIIVGTIWVDQSGESTVQNHKTGDHCKHKYYPYSYFSSETPRKVLGVVKDKEDVSHYLVTGTWDSHIDCAKIDSVVMTDPTKPQYKTQLPKRIWEKDALPNNAHKMYYFSKFAMSLNEDEEGVAPTDSRLRPDQRAMENGDWDAANTLKLGLEETQRHRIRLWDQLATNMTADLPSLPPLWFDRKKCEITKESTFRYSGKYWKHKKRQDWSNCPDIFTIGENRELSQSSQQSSTFSFTKAF